MSQSTHKSYESEEAATDRKMIAKHPQRTPAINVRTLSFDEEACVCVGRVYRLTFCAPVEFVRRVGERRTRLVS